MSKTRRDLLLSLAAAVILSGCVNTQAAIAPATTDDLALGIIADVESWFSWMFLLIGV